MKAEEFKRILVNLDRGIAPNVFERVTLAEIYKEYTSQQKTELPSDEGIEFGRWLQSSPYRRTKIDNEWSAFYSSSGDTVYKTTKELYNDYKQFKQHTESNQEEER